MKVKVYQLKEHQLDLCLKSNKLCFYIAKDNCFTVGMKFLWDY